RVVLADRPVVLLDEPSAHLDEATEAVLLRTLRTLARDALVVVVAHRAAVLRAADLVVELAPPADPGPVAPAEAPAPAAASAASPAAPPAVRAAPVAPRDEPDPPGRFGLRTGTVLGT